MSDWIKDLGEQNTMLVHTVEDLEQAACSRVKLLEEKLKQSSQMVADNLTRSNHSEEVRGCGSFFFYYFEMIFATRFKQTISSHSFVCTSICLILCMLQTLNTLSNRVSQLQKDEEYLHQKIEYLQSDIRGLLELIRRARWQNTWSLEGITFFEIQPDDIPIE